ncbi:DNA-directed RNA polymerase specialized sigma24 family protein [Catenulispora sp. MAP5-51]|uniref:hypothetical protein n=1 Tax=Catenulispora sp. MAP5-51 TaxID=3156298 RepID=UPI0035131847
MVNSSVFASITRDFNTLAEGPTCLIGGSSKAMRPLPLTETKALVLARTTSPELRDQLWSAMVIASRTEGDEWKTVAVAMALPGLANLTRQVVRDYAETDYEDVCAEVVAAFLGALRSVDIDRPAILTRMYWATYRAVRRSAYAEVLATKASAAAAAAAEVAHAGGHPDFVLARLIADSVITESEADLISAVRLDRRSLGDVAEPLGISANAVMLRLRKAEMRVAAHLTGTGTGSRRAFKRGRKGEVGIGSDSSGPRNRTSVVEEPPGDLAA